MVRKGRERERERARGIESTRKSFIFRGVGICGVWKFFYIVFFL